jgi:hypothetical protein
MMINEMVPGFSLTVAPRFGKGVPAYKVRTVRGPACDPRPRMQQVTVALPAGEVVTLVGFKTGYEGLACQWAVVRTADGEELTVASSELALAE